MAEPFLPGLRRAAAGAGQGAVCSAGIDPSIVEYQDLGLLGYDAAWDVQRRLVERRKAGEIGDRLLFVEHPPVITLGRNGNRGNLLLSESQLASRGIELRECDRGGDVTYHGPGQVVAYPIVDLRLWRRDVGAYMRLLEQVVIDAAAEFGIRAGRIEGCTGVWVGGAKLAALGVHISRWVTSHGFALNAAPQMLHFDCIVPCGLPKPVVSMEQLLGEAPGMARLRETLVRNFGRLYGREMRPLGEAAGDFRRGRSEGREVHG